jgi:hypothetical protein
MQPLDVAVFAPMKRRWRDLLCVWKDECAASGDNYATIPKQVIYFEHKVPFHQYGNR